MGDLTSMAMALSAPASVVPSPDVLDTPGARTAQPGGPNGRSPNAKRSRPVDTEPEPQQPPQREMNLGELTKAVTELNGRLVTQEKATVFNNECMNWNSDIINGLVTRVNGIETWTKLVTPKVDDLENWTKLVAPKLKELDGFGDAVWLGMRSSWAMLCSLFRPSWFGAFSLRTASRPHRLTARPWAR